MEPTQRGRLITIEGIDGVGKTTQIEQIGEFLRASRISYAVYREPGSTPLGEELRRILKAGPGQTPLAELLLFAAARVELVSTRVLPELSRGVWVILDRFADSMLAYQGALGGVDDELLAAVTTLSRCGLSPDLTLWFDLPPELAAERSAAAPDRIVMAEVGEMPLDAIERRASGYHRRVRERYAALQAAEPQRIISVDASLPLPDVTLAVVSIVRGKVEEWKSQG
ncbi:MAG: dTMP kinase [bacterium]|nr:dTMP kinase [bacterium]